MLEKEVKRWSQISAVIIYCYCLQIPVASLKLVNIKHDDYLLILNCTEAGEAHITCDK